MSDLFGINHVTMFLYTIFISFVVAQFEIQIEGTAAWAENLPTWRINNKWTRFFWDDKPLTGYHVWLNILGLTMAHIPFAAGIPWSLSAELFFLAMLCFATVFEDIWWFILNPAFGIKKFNSTDVPWHKHWLGPIPSMYIKYFIAAAIILFLSLYYS